MPQIYIPKDLYDRINRKWDCGLFVEEATRRALADTETKPPRWNPSAAARI